MDFLGDVLVSLLGSLGSLGVALVIYNRSKADQLRELETVLATDRAARQEQAERETRSRRIDGLHRLMTEAAQAMSEVQASMNAPSREGRLAAVSEVRSAADDLRPFMNVNLVSLERPKGSHFMDTLGFRLAGAQKIMMVAARAAEMSMDEKTATPQYISDCYSFLSTTWLAIAQTGEDVSKWETTGTIGPPPWPTGDYVDRLFIATDSSKRGIYSLRSGSDAAEILLGD